MGGLPRRARQEKGGGGEGRKKGWSQTGIPKGRGLSRSVREEEVRRAGPLPPWQSPKRRPRTSGYLLVLSQRGCKPGFPEGPGRAGSEGLASSLLAPRSPWVLLLVAQAQGPECWLPTALADPAGPSQARAGLQDPLSPRSSQRQHRLRSLWPLYPRMLARSGRPPLLRPRQAWVPCQPCTLSQCSCWPAAATAAVAGPPEPRRTGQL